jgi:tRNA-2-methylthio-N6-dimethylallyladenosine synthase
MINIFFKTYGCQANVADSQGLITYLKDLGCTHVEREEQADIIFVNSCAVREKAEQKMFSYIGEIVKFKRARPYMRMGVIGCVASYRKEEMYKRFDHLNFVFGAREQLGAFQEYLFDMITALETSKQLFEMNPDAPFQSAGQDRDIAALVEAKKRNPLVPALRLRKERSLVTSQMMGGGNEVKRSFINIMTGCNNYCTFCIVPFTRGREQSYPMSEIVERAARELEAGSKEITLIGQNVNSYKDPVEGHSFSTLLERIALLPGEFWVRFVSPHPKDITEDVIDVMARYPDKLCSWLHMPLQAGSDRILKLMNRTYTVERYMETISWIWKKLPLATITTDIIVGFPGETAQDYQGTRSVMEKVRYDHIYSFIYSPRKYTKAYKFEDTCPAEEKQERLEALQRRQKEICLEQNRRFEGRILKALVEKQLDGGKLLARTSGNVRVNLEAGAHHVGSFVDVLITKAHVANLEGILAHERVVMDASSAQSSAA